MSTNDGVSIHRDPCVFGGRPTIGDHRVTVHDVVALFEQGESVDGIATDFELTTREVDAALAFYREHKHQIDSEMLEDRRIISELAGRDTSPAAERLRAAWNGRRRAWHG